MDFNMRKLRSHFEDQHRHIIQKMEIVPIMILSN